MADNNHDDLILYGSLAVGVFIGVNALTKFLGGSQQDRDDISNQVNLPASQNAFSYNFQPAVDQYNSNPGYHADGTPLTMEEEYQLDKANFDAGITSYPINYDNARIAEAIHDQLTGWHLITDDNAIVGLFSQIPSQLRLSQISAYYLYNFGEDLLHALQGSLFKFGLNNADLAQIIKIINALPVQ